MDMRRHEKCVKRFGGDIKNTRFADERLNWLKMVSNGGM
jgi:hypothetical protein